MIEEVAEIEPMDTEREREREREGERARTLNREMLKPRKVVVLERMLMRRCSTLRLAMK